MRLSRGALIIRSCIFIIPRVCRLAGVKPKASEDLD
jgi:hypothetical protein